MVNAQEYINQKYPTKEEREKVTSLLIYNENLEGELDLSDFINLEGLYCNGNLLARLEFLNGLKTEKLVHLDIRNNDFNTGKGNSSPYDLSVFSKFINLKTLYIGNTVYIEDNLEVEQWKICN